jgi:hypothetical protein
VNQQRNHDGGLDHSLDLALVAGHPDPQTFETFNVWLVDGPRRLGVNMHLYFVRDGVARERASLFLPDGRTLITHSEGAYIRAEEPGGSSLRYRCVAPFQRWDFRWDAPAVLIDQAQEERGWVGDEGAPVARVSLAIEAETLTEPWIIPLSTGPSSLVGPAETDNGVFLGKYEQLLRGVGTIAVDGERWDFSGVGLRGHVRGPRDTTGMGSHAWVTGQFPGGRGFGLKQLFTLDGTPYFSEAYLAKDGRIERAEILKCPPFVRDAAARDFQLELRVGDHIARIEGENFRTTWIPLGGWENGAARGAGGGAFASGHGLAPQAAKIMSQSCARFTWDDEEGFGMCELSG